MSVNALWVAQAPWKSTRETMAGHTRLNRKHRWMIEDPLPLSHILVFFQGAAQCRHPLFLQGG
jgi:hypothetical protein